jgi:hypothetical protein
VFETAWTPPIAWLERIVQENPNLYFDMWTDEESGYKWCFEGSEGSLSNDLSDYIRDEVNNTISKIDPDKWVNDAGYDDDTATIFKENFEEIIEGFRDSGFWSRGGNWLEEFGDYFTDTWLSNYEWEHNSEEN